MSGDSIALYARPNLATMRPPRWPLRWTGDGFIGADFVKLWWGQSISMVGTRVTFLALPLTAILLLGAGPTELGLLNALQFAPYLLFGLLAGVWVDRLDRRRVAIATNLGLTVVVGSVPAAFVAGRLRIEQLYAVGFLAGTLMVLFTVACQSYLPELLPRRRLIAGNRWMEQSRSAAEAIGPWLAGAVIPILTAPGAIALDAVSYVLATVSLLTIRRERAAGPLRRAGIRAELVEGLAFVSQSPVLRSLLLCGAVANLATSMQATVALLYMTRDLRLSVAQVGLVLGAAGVASLVGASVGGAVPRLLGLGRSLVSMQLVVGLGGLLLPLAAGPTPLVVGLLLLASWIQGLAGPVVNINQLSLRQSLTPGRLQGRVSATMRFVIWGTMPAGAALGGLLGATLGLRTTLLVSGLTAACSAVFVVLSPVAQVRNLPARASEG
jgi:MFS family permease